MRSAVASALCLLLISCSGESKPPEVNQKSPTARKPAVVPGQDAGLDAELRAQERKELAAEKGRAEKAKRERLEREAKAARAEERRQDLEKLEELRLREERARAAARAWGSLNEIEKTQALQCARIFAERGFDGLTQEQLALLLKAGVTMEVLRRQDAKRRGQN